MSQDKEIRIGETLGVEKIPEYLALIEAKTGRQVKRIAFHKADLSDIVIPSEIEFFDRSTAKTGG